MILSKHKRAGVALHITSLPGRFGIGEIGESARRFIDGMRAMKLAVWQFLPIGPTAYGDSPYQPLSTFAGNEMLIDIADLIAMQLISAEEARELTRLPHEYVDYATLIPCKMRLLQLAASRFSSTADATLKNEFEKFLTQHDENWLHDYALFRILKTQHDEQPWPQWPKHFASRDTAAMREFDSQFATEIESSKIVQFLFHLQWRKLRDYANSKGVCLFGDMPIYIALDSADAWATPEILRIDGDGNPEMVAGVPPDYFSDDGQLWGNPLYAWDAHAASNFRWWVARLKAAIAAVDIVRIDHFRGFEAYWAIAATATTAREGRWEPGPGDAIFNAMRDACGDLPIVAEDLGVITPEVEALRDRHGLPGMKVLQFAVADPGFELAQLAENCVCYTGTHDNDTTIGWFRSSPADVQKAALRITSGTPETIHVDLITAALASNARLAIVPMQDFLGLDSDARLNTPGTTAGNWRWRVREEQLSAAVRQQVADLIKRTGRNN